MILKERCVSRLTRSVINMGWFRNGECTSLARLDYKTVVITGSNTGIGKYTAYDLVRRGGRVIMACRDLRKAEDAALSIKENLKKEGVDKGVGQLVIKQLDLASLASVRKCAQEILQEEQRVDILINNAGVMMCPKSLSVDGYENHLASNHLGHFLFTLLLLPLIIQSAPARIVNVASLAHTLARSMYFEDINLDKSYTPTGAYARSKLANILFTKELAKRLKGKNLNVYSLHPGVVNTELARHVDTAFFPGGRWLYVTLGGWFQKTPKQGAQTTLYCAIDEKTASDSGLYYDDCKVKMPSALARNADLAKELWQKSVEMVKLDGDPKDWA